MSREADLIRTFYAAFGRRDHAAMAACYAPDARFSDPVFRDLQGPRIAAMWRMLCERGADLRVEATGIEADGVRGSARWEAWYTFSATRRPVHNVIRATFAFRDGRIATHHDDFDLYRWARQALGAQGVLLGWTPFVQRAIRAQATGALEAFILKHAAG
jgi:ketosteroid isomerase-like protein